MPSEGYEKMLAHIVTNSKQIEASKKNMERERDHPHSRDYKVLKKEGARLADCQTKLKEEHVAHLSNHQKVCTRMEEEKKQWFMKPSPHATSTFVHEMICPRVLTSYSDALFCCRFVRLLIRLRTPGFQLLDFYNSWTIMLTQCIRCCSEREAQIFGVFLREMMSYILQLRRDETAYNAEMRDNPCFHRNYYEDPSAVTVEWAQFGDIRKGHSKWEGRIYKAMRQGLDAEDWMEKRNALLMMSQSYEAFPVVEKYARAILQAVEGIGEKEGCGDVKTLASSLAVKLKHRRDHWVDKQPNTPSTTNEEKQPRRVEDSKVDRAMGRSKNALGMSQQVRAEGNVNLVLENQANTGRLMDTRSERDRRHGAVTSTNRDVLPRDPRDVDRRVKLDVMFVGQESKEHKETKEQRRDRVEPKMGKDIVHDSRDHRVDRGKGDRDMKDVEKQRVDKDRERVERPKGASDKEKIPKDARDFERKRLGSNAPTPSSTPRSVTSGGERLETSSRAVTHDDRPDKRRRLDRDDNMAPVLHSRVANDRVLERHDGGGSHGVHPRNALSPPEPDYYSRGPPYDYRRSHAQQGRYDPPHRKR